MCYTFLFLHLSKFVRKSPLIISAAVLALFFACKKGDSVLGLDVQPENDILYSSYFDASVASSKTVSEESLVSSINNFGIYLLGSYNDPVFGRSDASIYTNFILKDNITNVNTGTKPLMDSVVLSLTYKIDYYGDTTDQLKLNVHLLTDSLKSGTTYYSNSTKTYDAADITESGNGYTFTPRPATYLTVGTDEVKPQLRIRLSKTWFEDNLLTMDNVNLASSAAMQEVFKGLLITTKNSTLFSPDHGSILFFSLFDNSTRITFYYHNFTSTGQKLEFTCGSGTGHFNNFEHDYGNAHASLKSQIDPANPDPTIQGGQQLFLQSMAGLGAKIYFPDLTSLCDSGPISVARAELIFPADQDAQYQLDNYKAPLGLFMKAYKSDGTLETMEDAGAYWFGGAYDNTEKQYKFNIARQVNLICNGKKDNYGFLLYPTESTSKPYRVVLGGGSSATYPIRLKIYYTKLFKE
jgi:hypothetical protein